MVLREGFGKEELVVAPFVRFFLLDQMNENEEDESKVGKFIILEDEDIA